MVEWLILIIPFLIGLAVAWFLTGSPVIALVVGLVAVLISQGVLTLGFDWVKLLGFTASLFGGSPS